FLAWQARFAKRYGVNPSLVRPPVLSRVFRTTCASAPDLAACSDDRARRPHAAEAARPQDRQALRAFPRRTRRSVSCRPWEDWRGRAVAAIRTANTNR